MAPPIYDGISQAPDYAREILNVAQRLEAELSCIDGMHGPLGEVAEIQSLARQLEGMLEQ